MSQATHPRDGSLEEAPPCRNTKRRLLDAAERLFAERGFEGTSLRALTQAAGTSISAAHYHFGSKEELLRATLERRVAPMNASRLERLDAAERAAAGAPLSVETLVGAYLDPLFEERATHRGSLSDVRFVAARLYSDPPELVSALKRELFGEVSRRFLDALARALPECSRDELGLRFQFGVGCMVHVMSGQIEDAPHAQGRDPLPDDVVHHALVRFLSAGLRAPAGDPR